MYACMLRIGSHSNTRHTHEIKVKSRSPHDMQSNFFLDVFHVCDMLVGHQNAHVRRRRGMASHSRDVHTSTAFHLVSVHADVRSGGI
jgi:hypothetical protein